jgi:hypothetical protein
MYLPDRRQENAQFAKEDSHLPISRRCSRHEPLLGLVIANYSIVGDNPTFGASAEGELASLDYKVYIIAIAPCD